MRAYIIRRLLLMIPTMLGITISCFTLIQFVPGGPVEQVIAQVTRAGSDAGQSADQKITQEEIENIKAYFGFDQPAYIRYFKWLGNVMRLDFGTSYTYRELVWDVIIERIPISLFFGLTSFLLSYLICVPLGIRKAVKNHSTFDTTSSIIIFVGYVIPGYALGILLILFFGSYLDLLPISGIVSDNFEDLSFLGKVGDFLSHMIMPMVCYMAGEFAFLTLLMKNSLLDEIKKDYMRTALVKGSTFSLAVYRHALRNALIPIATRLSEVFTLIFASALLIEKVFDIDGMGLLVFNSIVSRDYNVVMAIIMITSVLALFGRLFSDILYVVVDPRIRFN